MRDMKFHIYNADHEPLCWDDCALEFDFAEDAYEFLKNVDEDLVDGVVIVQDILFYDGGYINATNLRVSEDEETGELILIEVEGK